VRVKLASLKTKRQPHAQREVLLHAFAQLLPLCI